MVMSYEEDFARKQREEELKKQNQTVTGFDTAKAYGIGGAIGASKLANLVTNNPALYSAENVALATKAGNVAKNLGRTNAFWSLGNGAVAGLTTDNQQYRDRFRLGEEDYTQNPVIGGIKAAAIQTLGAATDVADSAGLGLPSKIMAGLGIGYDDKNMAKWNPEIQSQATAQNKVSTVANPLNPTPNNPALGYDPKVIGNFTANRATNLQTTPQTAPISQAEFNQLANNRMVSTNPQTGTANLDVFGNPAQPNAPVVPVGTKVEKFEMPDIKPPTQAELAMRALQNVGASFKDPNVNMPTAPRRDYDERMQREKLMDAINKPIAGAKGITANQLRIMSDLAQGDDKLKQEVYNQQMAMAQAQLREQGSNERALLNEQGTNARTMLNEVGTNERFNTSHGLDMEKFRQATKMEEAQLGLDMDKFKQEMQNANTQNYATNRMINLQTQYDNAKTDDERQAIIEKANATLGGKAGNASDDFVKLNGGVDASGNNVGDILYNVKTGQTVNPRGGQGQVKVSQEQIQQIVNDTSLSTEERKKKLHELGVA